MEVEFVVAFKLACNSLLEITVAVQPRDFEFVFHCEQLEVVARDGFGQRRLAGKFGAFGLTHEGYEIAVCFGVACVLIVREESNAARFPHRRYEKTNTSATSPIEHSRDQRFAENSLTPSNFIKNAVGRLAP